MTTTPPTPTRLREPRSARIIFSVSPSERERLREAARQAGCDSLAVFIRTRALAPATASATEARP